MNTQSLRVLAVKQNLMGCTLRDLAERVKQYDWIDKDVPLNDLLWLVAVAHVRYAEMPVPIPKLGNVEMSQECLKGYEIKKLLGFGTYGVVSNACLEDDCTYAVKIQYLGTDQPLQVRFGEQVLKEKNKERLRNINNFERETALSAQFNTKEIGPKYHGSWQCTMNVNDQDQRFGIIVTELWAGSLDKYSDKCEIDPKLLEKLFQQIQEIHKLGYVHADIALRNVLFKVDSAGKLNDLTLSDFGFVRLLKDLKNDISLAARLYNNDFPNSAQYYSDNAITRTDVQLEPELLDYSLLYTLQACNKRVKSTFKEQLLSEISARKRSLNNDQFKEVLNDLLTTFNQALVFNKQGKFLAEIGETVPFEYQRNPDAIIIKGPQLESEIDNFWQIYQNDIDFRKVIDGYAGL